MKLFFKILFLISYVAFSQNINVNNNFEYNYLRSSILNSEINTNLSFNIRPLNLNAFPKLFIDQWRI